jgi:hypothetical protein
MRALLCNKCVHVFRGGGQGRVMRKILFFFCDKCWTNRQACEEFMRRIAL